MLTKPIKAYINVDVPKNHFVAVFETIQKIIRSGLV